MSALLIALYILTLSGAVALDKYQTLLLPAKSYSDFIFHCAIWVLAIIAIHGLYIWLWLRWV